MAANKTTENTVSKEETELTLGIIGLIIGVLLALITIPFALMSEDNKTASRKWVADNLRITKIETVWVGILIVLAVIIFLIIIAYFVGKKKHAKQIENPSYAPTILTPYNPFLRLIFRFASFLDWKKAYFTPLIKAGRYFEANLNRIFRKPIFRDAEYVSPTEYTFLDDIEIAVIAKKMDGDTAKNKKKLEEYAKDLHALFNNGFFKTDINAKANVLILADSGVGKTTFLQKLYYDYARTYPNVNLAFVYAGENTLAQINDISDELASNTILFLDAFDEDITVRQKMEKGEEKEAENEFSQTLKRFRQVIITCRQQFYHYSEEWQEISDDMKFFKLHLKPFTAAQARKYLTSKYKGEDQVKALAIFEKAKKANLTDDYFFQKPLLLSYMYDFIATTSKIKWEYLCDIYRHIVQKQVIEREGIAESHKQKQLEKLLKYSKKIAKYELDKDIVSIDIDSEEIAAIIKETGMDKVDAQSRSFLTRNLRQKEYRFSHQSFFDYFLALSLLDQDIEEEDEKGKSFDFSTRPEMRNFYNEMCWLYRANVKSPLMNGNKILDLGDDQNLKLYVLEVLACPELPITLFQNRAIRAMMIRHYKALEKYNIQDSPYWYEWIGFLMPICKQAEMDADAADKYVCRHYVFQDLVAAKKAEDTDRFYNQLFLDEMEYQKIVGEHPTGDTLQIKGDESLAVNFGELLLGLLKDNHLLRNLYKNYLRITLQNLDIQNLAFCDYFFKDLLTLDLQGNAFTDIKIIAERFRKLKTLHLPFCATQNKDALRAVLELPYLETLHIDGVEQLRSLRELMPPNMVQVEGGTFMMGKLDKDERTNSDYTKSDNYDIGRLEMPHKVRVSSFEIGKYAVTVGEFRVFVKDTKYEQHLIENEAGEWQKGSWGWDETKGEQLFIPNVGWEHDVAGNLQTNDRMPVIHISWIDAAHYCNWLNKKEGKKEVYTFPKHYLVWNTDERKHVSIAKCTFSIRKIVPIFDKPNYVIKEVNGGVETNIERKGYCLPSEAEWEYAARSEGQQHLYGNGKDIADSAEMNFNANPKYADGSLYIVGEGRLYKRGNYEAKTLPVGSFEANPLRLHEMSGNVFEWCQDVFDPDYYQKCIKNDFQDNPINDIPYITKNELNGILRVLRGGSWADYAHDCGVSYRNYGRQTLRYPDIGFRLLFVP